MSGVRLGKYKTRGTVTNKNSTLGISLYRPPPCTLDAKYALTSSSTQYT